jgi:Tol biopolymer transport system component
MKQKTYLYASLICLVLLAAAITYNLLNEEDQYLGFTGLGGSIKLSEDDRQIYFSYYQDGKESIYRANTDGGKVEQLTHPDDERHRKPDLSLNGEKMLYLSENSDRIQSLYIADLNGENRKKLTDDTIHVEEAVFSENEIYFVGMPAEAVGKAEGETKEGYDLHSVGMDGENEQKLTDQDYFTMNHLAISTDGSQLYYTLFNGTSDKIYAYHVEDKRESLADWVPAEVGSLYDWDYDEVKQAFTYTDVSEESEDRSLFKYELYYRDLNENRTKQLTTLESSVVSPDFFHQSDKIAFLHYTNWSGHPEKYQLKTVDINTKEMNNVTLDLPESTNSHRLREALNIFTSSTVIAILYTVLLCLVTLYSYKKSGKQYRTGLISLLLAVAVFISSFIFGMLTNPWVGIAVSIVAIGMVPSSLIALIVGFLIGKFAKKPK